MDGMAGMDGEGGRHQGATAGRVIVGSDGSPHSEVATRWAADWASSHGLGLTLLAAHGPFEVVLDDLEVLDRITRDEAHQASESLDATADWVRRQHPDLDVQTLLLHAHPAGALIDRSVAAALTVVGTRGATGVRRFVLGGTADAVVTHGSGPIAVIPSDAPVSGDSPILVGVDSSDGSAAALRFACEAAQATGRTLRAVHAWEVARMWTGTPVFMPRQLVPAIDGTDERSRFLSNVVAPLAEAFPDVQIEEVSAEGNAADVLAELSRYASLVVVGSRGRAGFTGLLLGSTSRRIAQSSDSPVVVVHERKAGAHR